MSVGIFSERQEASEVGRSISSGLASASAVLIFPQNKLLQFVRRILKHFYIYNTTQQRKSWGAGNFPFNWAALYCAHFEGEKLYDLQSYSWQTTDKPCQAWSHSCLCSYFLQVTCLVGVSIPMSDPAAGRAEQRSQGNVTLWSMFLTDRNMPSFQHFLRG